jgi:hypothetical protein
MFVFQQNQPIAVRRTLSFLAVDENDLQSRQTGLAAFTVRIRKPGVANAAATNAPTEVSAANLPGVYELELTAAELNTVGFGVVHVSKAGTEPREIPFRVDPAYFGTVTSTTLGASSFSTDLTSYASDYFNDALVRFLTGNLAGQVKKIGDFTSGNGLITLAGTLAFTGAPADGDIFEILTA